VLLRHYAGDLPLDGHDTGRGQLEIAEEEFRVKAAISAHHRPVNRRGQQEKHQQPRAERAQAFPLPRLLVEGAAIAQQFVNHADKIHPTFSLLDVNLSYVILAVSGNASGAVCRALKCAGRGVTSLDRPIGNRLRAAKKWNNGDTNNIFIV